VTHTHAVQFYENERFLCDVVARYVSDGLRSGAPIAAVVTEPHRVVLERDLRALGVDVDVAISRRQLKLCDAHETLAKFMVGRRPDRTRFFRCAGDLLAGLDGGFGGARPRACGEMVDVLWKAGQSSAALELEELWSEVTRRRSLSLLCAYALDNFAVGGESQQFDRVCAFHTHVIPTERFATDAPVEARLREVAQLQQRARALENEVARRKRSEHALRLRELQLREEHEQLTTALRAKDEFLSTLGHELRNPLAPILLAADLMRDRTGDSTEQEVIERQVKQLTRLVDDLLDMARLSRGKLVLQKRVVLLHDVVVRAVELALPEGDPRRADVLVELPWDLELEVDPQRMAQALANLLTNAAKFSDRGTPIEVTAQLEGGRILLVVRDRGIGIDPEIIDRVFELFVQHPQALAHAGGLGLGLPLVRCASSCRCKDSRRSARSPTRGSSRCRCVGS